MADGLPRILHLISGLEVGGAEMMLFQLIEYSQGRHLDNYVLSMTESGLVGERLKTLGIPVDCLHMERGRVDLGGYFRLRKWLRNNKIDLMQTWMYHANLLGSLATKKPVVWGIHNTDLAGGKSKWLTVLTDQVSAYLSHWKVVRIIYCAETARHIHEKHGYARKKGLVIYNGFDVKKFQPDPLARNRLVKMLKIDEIPPFFIIGHVGRFDSQKDYPTLIQSFGFVAEQMPRTHFVLCGKQIDSGNLELEKLITDAGIDTHVHLMGNVSNITEVMPGFDLQVLSSAYGEAFPMVLGEAMACGVLCVSTNVGDSSTLLGGYGRIVSPKNPQALANAIVATLSKPKKEFDEQRTLARERIINHFELSKVLDTYISTYQSLLMG